MAVYWPAVRCGFVRYDDDLYVLDNARVLRGLTADNVAWAFTALDVYWQPLTWLSLMLDTDVFGTGPAGYHFTNVLLHAGTPRRRTGAADADRLGRAVGGGGGAFRRPPAPRGIGRVGRRAEGRAGGVP